jgi:hypothetical protein
LEKYVASITMVEEYAKRETSVQQIASLFSLFFDPADGNDMFL